MIDTSRFRLNALSAGVLLSLFLHGLIVAALLIDLPKPEMEAEPEEQVVTVTIVPPPEPEPEPEQPEPEQPTPEEAAPEPETPEPETPEPETPEPEAPAPEEPAPEEAVPELPAAAADASEGEGVPIPVLRPVFQFGEEDAGPEIALDGGASAAPAEEAPVEETLVEEPPAEEPPAEELPAEELTVEELLETPPPEPAAEPEAETAVQDQQPTDTPADQPPADPAPVLAMPDDITLPDAELAGDTPGALPDAAAETELASLPEDPADPASAVPEPKPAEPAKPAAKVIEPPADPRPADNAPASDNGLPGVRQLSSSVNTGRAVATTAMRNMPRDARGSQLCTTELREQLRRAPEPYQPELLPSYRLPGGNVLSVPKAAFRARGIWYDLNFRCTVDADALRVVDFTFKVGNAIPRSQWQARGFPSY
ncbi:DUF930 domain-containing protein [Hoeflea sp. AS60]|uniref:DUF930 domain-containing protein n=1 Tax=Hoeflea sp. AS60 TaxID=3135780 RepID=UPI00317FC647